MISLALGVLVVIVVGLLAYDALRLEQHCLQQGSGPGVILVCMGGRDSGMERCALLQQQAFIDAGIDSVLVCNRKGWIAQQALARKLPVVLCANTGICSQTFAWLPGVQRAIEMVIKYFGDRLLVVHCNMPREVFAAKRAIAKKQIPVIFSQHTQTNIVSATLRRAVDGFIGVSPAVVAQFAQLNKQDGIHCPIFVAPPYVDHKRFLHTQVAMPRELFFQKEFNVHLKRVPLLLQIAHIPKNHAQKGHPLLLYAMHELMYHRAIPMQVAFAGGGEQETLKALVHELNLDDYVYFLGNSMHTPQLLFYADLNVLASGKEALSMVVVEGGLLGKPSIVARGTGMADWLITDRKTGFLFEPDNVQSLADTIAYVLAHHDEAQEAGKRLYERAITHFLPSHVATLTMAFYRQVARAKSS